MSMVKYEIVEHDGGWAYRVGATFSETFPSHDLALAAATRAAGAQQQAGSSETISYEDRQGEWHRERADGSDRPATSVKD